MNAFGESSSRGPSRQYLTVVSDVDRLRWDSKVDGSSVRDNDNAPISPNDIPTLQLTKDLIAENGGGVGDIDAIKQQVLDAIMTDGHDVLVDEDTGLVLYA